MTQELAESVLAGSRRALSRVLSLVENDEVEGREALRLLVGPPLRPGVRQAPARARSWSASRRSTEVADRA